MKNIFLIKNEHANTRLDRWIKRTVCDVPQSLIEKNLRKGNIKVNNSKIKSSYKLKINDKIIIRNLLFTPNKNKKKLEKYIPTKKELNHSSEMIIENNKNFVVLNKPPHISVQSGTKSRKNIMDILIKTKEFTNSKPFPVHRIDKETTGILIVAKNRAYAQLFTSLFRIRKIHKEYLAVTLGVIPEKKGIFKDKLYYHERNKKICLNAITRFNVVDSSNNYSLLKLYPETGRKHQLRKQLLLRGYPIIGDNKYRISKKTVNKKNIFMLHAYKITFSVEGYKYKFIAKPPLAFRKFLNEKNLKIF